MIKDLVRLREENRSDVIVTLDKVMSNIVIRHNWAVKDLLTVCRKIQTAAECKDNVQLCVNNDIFCDYWYQNIDFITEALNTAPYFKIKAINVKTEDIIYDFNDEGCPSMAHEEYDKVELFSEIEIERILNFIQNNMDEIITYNRKKNKRNKRNN